MPVALTPYTRQRYSRSKECEQDFFVTNFRAETIDGTYRFIFDGRVPFQLVMFFLNEVSHSFAKSGALINFIEVVENASESAREIKVDPRVLLFSFIFRDREKLMALLELSLPSPAYH